jgi:hypothetical protein
LVADEPTERDEVNKQKEQPRGGAIGENNDKAGARRTPEKGHTNITSEHSSHADTL